MSTLGAHIAFENGEIIESASEIFEIDDFTSPSAWEKFESQFENILRDWNLHRKNRPKIDQNWPWKCRNRNLIFHDFEFKSKCFKSFLILKKF